MARLSESQAGGRNVLALLDAIAYCEGTAGRGDDGYNVQVGGALFEGYDKHPTKLVWLPTYKVNSSAAGRYQFLSRTWKSLQALLKLPDFGPESQDRAAIELIRERGALEDVRAGRIKAALVKIAPIWASLPGAGYGQREIRLQRVLDQYRDNGGKSVSE
jgi:muramidase (phage lysozyme)